MSELPPGWLKDVLEENRRIVESWPAWKRVRSRAIGRDVQVEQLLENLRSIVELHNGDIHALALKVRELEEDRDNWKRRHGEMCRVEIALRDIVQDLEAKLRLVEEKYRLAVHEDQRLITRLEAERDQAREALRSVLSLCRDKSFPGTVNMRLDEIEQHVCKALVEG